MIQVTEENAHKYHRYMWRWLSRHPGMFKFNWPGWRKIENKSSHCFACMIAIERSADLEEYGGTFSYCIACPIKEWRIKAAGYVKNEDSMCTVDNSPFDNWNNAWNECEEEHFASVISEMEWE